MKKPTIKNVKTKLVGKQVNKNHAVRGTEIHNAISKVNPSMNSGEGADFPQFDVEVKSKDVNSNSAYGIASMTIDNIKNDSYNNSTVRQKLQQQLQITVDNGLVIDEEIYDFRPQWIQEKFEEAYETARSKIIRDDRSNYIHGSKYGYFEKRTNSDNSYQFRISVGAMRELKTMAKNQINNPNLFEQYD